MDISKPFGSARFFAFALSLDKQLAEDLKIKGCVFCKGALHFSCYQRKSRFLLTLRCLMDGIPFLVCAAPKKGVGVAVDLCRFAMRALARIALEFFCYAIFYALEVRRGP